MPSKLAWCFVFCLAVPAWAGAGQASSAEAPAPRVSPSDRGPFTKGTIGIELAGTLAAEAWNLNGNREWVTDATFAIWWAYGQGRSFAVEFHAAPVLQDGTGVAFVQAVLPVFRCRVLERGRTTMFVEFGGGYSWSDRIVPPRGTRFNFLTATSVGVARRLSPQAHAVASLRWMHLSNASREGRDRNPDIEAIGGFFGVSIGF
jgi:hypothetical protein